MKKTLLIIACISLLTGFTACGKKGELQPSDQTRSYG